MSQIVNCKDCSTPFEITDGEEKFYTDKGFTFPKRCEPCRKKKKQRFENRDRGYSDNRRDKRSFEDSEY